MVFKSKRIERAGDEYVAWGELTIRGVTKEVPLRFTLVGPVRDPGKLSRLGVEARTTVNRQDFGVSWNRALDTGGVVVSDEVRVEINAELIKVDPATGQPIKLE
jgi:polyisoprenoid-binding protein YceI